MTMATVCCPLCALTFDPRGQAACRDCPLNPGCQVTCCPSCGYSWVEPEHTKAGRLLRRWFHPAESGRGAAPYAVPTTLADLPAGWKARLSSWETTPARRRQQLRAYGMTESAWIVVLQHTPTTVLRVGLTELALERELAATILVRDAQPTATPANRPSSAA